MFSAKLIRWSGLAAIIGAIFFIVAAVLQYFIDPQGDLLFSALAVMPVYQTATWLNMGGLLLIYFGLLGLYARQVEPGGLLGAILFALTTIFTVMFVSIIWVELFIAPSLAEAAPAFLDSEPTGLMSAGFMLGWLVAPVTWLLMGLLTLKTAVLPRTITWAFIIGILVGVGFGFLLPESAPGFVWVITNIIFALGIGAMGYGLWMQRDAITTKRLRPAPLGA